MPGLNENVLWKTRTNIKFIISQATEIDVLAYFEAYVIIFLTIQIKKMDHFWELFTIFAKSIRLCLARLPLHRRKYQEINKFAPTFVSGSLNKS